MATFQLPDVGPRAPVSAAAVMGTTRWLGWDWGEWGGALASVDLVTGAAAAHESDNVNGMAVVGGKLLAFGGAATWTF
jgi:hypothetical protein